MVNFFSDWLSITYHLIHISVIKFSTNFAVCQPVSKHILIVIVNGKSSSFFCTFHKTTPNVIIRGRKCLFMGEGGFT